MIIYIIILQLLLEVLPVSSSGHMLLLERILCILFNEKLINFLHGPTLIVVAFLFRRNWFSIVQSILRIVFKSEVRNRDSAISFAKIISKILLYGFVIDFITLISYLWFKPLFSNISNTLLALAFATTALLIFSLKKISEKKNSLTFFRAVIIGLAQAFAVIPGISRFGTTFVTARYLGISNRRAFQISFLVHVPIMCVGFVMGLRSGLALSFYEFTFIILCMILSYFLLAQIYFMALKNNFWKLSYLLIPVLLLLKFFTDKALL